MLNVVTNFRKGVTSVVMPSVIVLNVVAPLWRGWLGRWDIQHNDTQHYDSQHIETQHVNIQHNDTLHNDT
jgi:hypothetical protein